MKFFVMKKAHRVLYAVLSVILFVLSLIILSILFFVNLYEEGRPVIIVLVAMQFVLISSGVALLVVSAFSKVMLDEVGIALYFGKIRLNKFNWTSVKRIELVAVGANCWFFNVMTIDKPSFSFRRGRMVENLNKIRITFNYDANAQEIITQYYGGEIINPQPR